MTTIITPKDRNNSRQLDWHLWTDVPAMEAILRAIAPSIEKSHLKSRETNLQVMVTNLVAAYLLDPERYVAYSRRKKSYVKFARYNEQDLGYDPMVAISDSLQTEGWCEQITGDISPFAKERKLTRIRAAAKMVELIGRSGITLDAIGRHPDEELVILRDCKEAGEKKGKDIDYPESAFTHEARGRLRAYNNMLPHHLT
jgi:hypothetical protein